MVTIRDTGPQIFAFSGMTKWKLSIGCGQYPELARSEIPTSGFFRVSRHGYKQEAASSGKKGLASEWR
jgi:hypothetical protein